MEKKVIVVEDANKAVETLEKLKAGATVERSLPAMLREAWGDRVR
jgi:hypothetical protein